MWPSSQPLRWGQPSYEGQDACPQMCLLFRGSTVLGFATSVLIHCKEWMVVLTKAIVISVSPILILSLGINERAVPFEEIDCTINRGSPWYSFAQLHM